MITLDQEKVYDKVAHPYLWEILKRVGFSDEIIYTIKTLYSNARTSVIINRVISNPFTITRGVQQGGLMLCILFNLGIKPLALNI